MYKMQHNYSDEDGDSDSSPNILHAIKSAGLQPLPAKSCHRYEKEFMLLSQWCIKVNKIF